MRTRVGGTWRLHAVAQGGWLREMVLLNQEESVVVVEAGDWKIEGCLLAAASRGVMGSDVIIVRNRCTVSKRPELRTLQRCRSPCLVWGGWLEDTAL